MYNVDIYQSCQVATGSVLRDRTTKQHVSCSLCTGPENFCATRYNLAKK